MDNQWHLRFLALERYLALVMAIVCGFLYCFIVFRFFGFSPGQVNGPSMESTYIDDQMFLVNKHVYLFHPPERFDIVQAIDPTNQKLVIKRVIGLPGETIVMKQGKFFLRTGLNDIELVETYLRPGTYTTTLGQNQPIVITLKAGEFFLAGDNREHSTDSRQYGPVSRTKIIGQVKAGDKK